MKGKKYIYAHKFEGLPKLTDLELVEEELPPLKDGDVLVKVQCLSLDPYMRPYAVENLKEGDVMMNFFVAGHVIDSKHESFSNGTLVCGPFGWTTHAVIQGKNLTKMDYLQDLSASAGLGAAGMPGLTAYFGVLNVLEPKEGETLYVNSAAGAVGSIVGQIAKIKGCRVIGSAGSDEKVAFLKSLGFDEAFNYKTVTSVEDELKKLCPDGIDMFFENVGGPEFSKVIKLLRMDGRAAVCGAISQYNSTEPVFIEEFMMPLIKNRIKIQGLHVHKYFEEWPSGRIELVKWIKEGKIKIKEHVTKGFENLPKAFIELFTGGNFGKAVVMV
ncbi:prostaglandin reductase 1-like [Xenia sp. Carnegie-2017]|uniref:prostaglandin reductase 1-like n=1 Tax=Xenia sp. Carnegie-2017 TaxID=2897299 RepID=UPI001F03610F|nr:prostaglandin reductase 1-like [Xenia sp. Carnegie-2017]